MAGALAGSLGFAAHVLPLAAAVVAVRYLRGLPLRPRWIPLAGWSLSLLSLAAGFEILHRAFPDTFAASAGGVLGAAVVGPLSRAFYLAGSSFVLLIAAALGLLAATGVSLRDATQGARQLAARRHARARPARARERWRGCACGSRSARSTAPLGARRRDRGRRRRADAARRAPRRA